MQLWNKGSCRLKGLKVIERNHLQRFTLTRHFRFIYEIFSSFQSVFHVTIRICYAYFLKC